MLHTIHLPREEFGEHTHVTHYTSTTWGIGGSIYTCYTLYIYHVRDWGEHLHMLHTLHLPREGLGENKLMLHTIHLPREGLGGAFTHVTHYTSTTWGIEGSIYTCYILYIYHTRNWGGHLLMLHTIHLPLEGLGAAYTHVTHYTSTTWGIGGSIYTCYTLCERLGEHIHITQHQHYSSTMLEVEGAIHHIDLQFKKIKLFSFM